MKDHKFTNTLRDMNLNTQPEPNFSLFIVFTLPYSENTNPMYSTTEDRTNVLARKQPKLLCSTIQSLRVDRSLTSTGGQLSVVP